MLTVSRRGFLALGGTGAAVLAGCGGEVDPRAEGDDPELLDAALEAEAGLEAAYGNLSGGAVAAGAGAEVVKRSRDASAERQQELGRLGAGEPTGDGSTAAAGTGLESVEPAANAAIAAYREAARLLSTTEGRSTTMGFLAQVAAELAAIRGLFGADQAPEAFVTGGTEKPFEAAAEETTTTSTTSTSTTDSTTSTDEQ